MISATIKLFLPRGDAQSLRTAEISNWTGKAIAAPRTELDDLLAREETEKAGVYILIGTDLETGLPRAYIGEAEVIADRLKKHKGLEFWVSVIVFASKDENLTKAHVRYLESRLTAQRNVSSWIRTLPVGPSCRSQTAKTWKCFSTGSGNSCPFLDRTCFSQSCRPAQRRRQEAFSSVATKMR